MGFLLQLAPELFESRNEPGVRNLHFGLSTNHCNTGPILQQPLGAPFRRAGALPSRMPSPADRARRTGGEWRPSSYQSAHPTVNQAPTVPKESPSTQHPAPTTGHPVRPVRYGTSSRENTRSKVYPWAARLTYCAATTLGLAQQNMSAFELVFARYP